MFQRLLWRADRISHVSRHDLTCAEVEEAVFDDQKRRMFRGPRSERDQTRFVYYVYGRTLARRYLLVVLLDLGKGLGLPITARNMTHKERERYERR
ncbi:MAG: BrnT family toxin [Chloroflexi bacterium]|nr:BrnT family toxin [Chloroflexota bacterium]